MDDPQPPSASEQPPYIRLPWPLVGAGLLAILLLALAAGLLANRYLRPQVGLVPTPQVVAAPPPIATTVLSATSQPTLTAAIPAATATAIPATPVPTSTPVGAPQSVTPSARPTLDPVAVAEVSKAYDQYWAVRTQALLELDESHLTDVMEGNHLQLVTRRIEELRVENRAIQTDVDHQYRVTQATNDSAQVFDDYLSNSIYVVPLTKQPLSEPTSDELMVLYTLVNYDGTWKVVDSVQAH